MGAFLIRWFITTLAVFLAERIVPGIECNSAGTLLGGSLLLGIINAFVRPVLLILSLPFILVTMGLFILVINALMLMLVGALLPGFEVHGFWSAFFGAIIIGIVSWALSSFFRGSDGRVYTVAHHSTIKQAQGRTLD